jgi:hypothetical protein
MFSGPNSGMFGIGCSSCITPVIGVAGDLSLGEIDGLINPSAISLLKANAYQAAKQVLGARTKDDILYKVVDTYAAFTIPKTNRALTVFEIAHDMNFKRIANKTRDDEKSLGDTTKGLLSGLGVIPKLAIYGVGGYAAYRGYKWYRAKHPKGSNKRGGFFGKLFGTKTRKRTKHRKTRSITKSMALPIGGL